MIRKIIILALAIAAGYFFYTRYMSSTMNPFFNKNKGNVDFLGITAPTVDKAMSVKDNAQ
jgi:hypothetical protein